MLLSRLFYSLLLLLNLLLFSFALVLASVLNDPVCLKEIKKYSYIHNLCI